ncbi:MAG: ribonuclease III [Terrimesophilobacter sp.]
MTKHRVIPQGDLPDTAELAILLGVPVDADLLGLALIHRSFAYENGGIRHNERLEFLGDSILGQAVTVMLYTEYPDLVEGDLAKRRSSLVSSVALAEVARRIDLGRFLRLGKGEEQTGGREKSSILADTVEAVIGAVYLSSGGEIATDLVLRLIRPLMDDPHRFGAALDPKTSLQEFTTAAGLGMPLYEILDSGPDHSKRFRAAVVLGGKEVASGEGSSKKHAEMAAALSALGQLQGEAGVAGADSAHGAPAGAAGATAAGATAASPSEG